MRKLVLSALVLFALALPGGAHAAQAKNWATVNVCRAGQGTNTLGVRAAMPWLGGYRRLRMSMRFEAQYYRKARGRFVTAGTRSPWRRVEKRRGQGVQSGYSFAFAKPAAGQTQLLRGRVEFEWRAPKRRRWRVVQRTAKATRAGIRGVQFGDPKGRSDATCTFKG